MILEMRFQILREQGKNGKNGDISPIPTCALKSNDACSIKMNTTLAVEYISQIVSALRIILMQEKSNTPSFFISVHKITGSLNLSESNVDISRIFYRLRDIRNRNMQDIHLYVSNGPMSNVNMPIENPYATFCLLAMVMFAQYVTVYKIITYTYTSRWIFDHET